MTSIQFPVPVLLAYALALSRIAAFVALVPIPGFRAAPPEARIALAVVTAWLIQPFVRLPTENPDPGTLLVWVLQDAAFGIAAALCVGFLLEAAQLGAQIAGLNMGFGYASTIDPTSEADTGLLGVPTSLMAGLLFWTGGYHREFIRAAASGIPVGAAASALDPAHITRLGAGMFGAALKLALPTVASMLLVDVGLAIVGKLEQQLQPLSLAFAAKILIGFLLFALLGSAMSAIFAEFAGHALDSLQAFRRSVL